MISKKGAVVPLLAFSQMTPRNEVTPYDSVLQVDIEVDCEETKQLMYHNKPINLQDTRFYSWSIVGSYQYFHKTYKLFSSVYIKGTKPLCGAEYYKDMDWLCACSQNATDSLTIHRLLYVKMHLELIWI